MLLSNEILISKVGEETNMTMTKDLQTIGKELTKLVKQIEKLAAELGKADQPKAKSVKTKTKAKAVIKNAPVKAAKKTDTDKLLAIVNRSKKGVDTAALMKKTGFDQKKVRNMLNRTYKQGKITRVEKGIYVGVK
jgi:predicted Rossmann fold nucleotide-binding protein DprA/Smf involved in DNA uptake